MKVDRRFFRLRQIEDRTFAQMLRRGWSECGCGTGRSPADESMRPGCDSLGPPARVNIASSNVPPLGLPATANMPNAVVPEYDVPW